MHHVRGSRLRTEGGHEFAILVRRYGRQLQILNLDFARVELIKPVDLGDLLAGLVLQRGVLDSNRAARSRISPAAASGQERAQGAYANACRHAFAQERPILLWSLPNRQLICTKRRL